MKRTLLKKTLAMILVTVVLSAVLTAVAFRYYGTTVFARIKIDEMMPRATFLSETSASYLEGYIGNREYDRVINSEYRIWDASLYVYDAKGTLFVWPSMGDSTANLEAIAHYLPRTLAGETIALPYSELKVGVIVGKPIVSSLGNVIGAVFLIKPIHEINTALGGLMIALLVSMLLVTAIMIVPAYFGSRQLTKPLNRMNEAASAMARGDFSVRAHEEGTDEVADLGRTLNYLSGALSNTIGDLTFERNRLRAVLDGLGEGIVAVSPEGAIMQYNPAAVRLLGGGEDDALPALAAYAEITKDMGDVLRDALTRVIERRCGEAVLRIAITALHEKEGLIEGALVLIQDVTEAARLEQTRRDYVANVSHELRNPLASIRSLADALNDGLVKGDEDKARYYGYILRESVRLSRLIDDLLELSRLQSGSVALTKRRMDLAELITDVADRFEGQIKEQGGTLSVLVPEHCPHVNGNPDRVEQVLIALMDNAVRHSSEAGVIALEARDAGGRMVISVTNEGSIPEEDMAHLFDRFYKVDKSHSGAGTGLGLAISKEIMLLMGERIWAEQRSGRVIFSFTLARAAD